jgi:cobalt transporter subunit CbtA
MVTRTLLVGLLAGLAAGVALTVVYLVGLQPLILAAEAYEDPALEAPFVRIIETILFNILTGAGYGLVLSAILTLRGKVAGWREGLLWGAAGFAAFALAPALGLPPELPGMQAAALEARQIWWLLTVAATALGLAQLVFFGRPALRIAGVALIAVPHIVGAPLAVSPHGAVPPELAARFAVFSLAASALFWAVLGGCCGYLYNRLSAAAEPDE